MRRRDFITLVGGAAAAWPLRAGAQQLAIPVIGFLSGRFPNDSAANVTAFHRGLGEVGFVDGQNVEIDFRWAFGHYIQLRDAQAAADPLRVKLIPVGASRDGELETAFTAVVERGAGGLAIAADPFFTARAEQLAVLAAVHAVPAIHPVREYPAAGGLM